MEPHVFIKAIPEIVTQLLAFGIVFLILKKYAFGTVFNMLDQRQKEISKSFKDIEQKKAQLERLEKEYRSKLRHIDQEARGKIQEAIQEGSRFAQEMREKARVDSLRQMERAKADIDQELAKARTLLRNQMVDISAKMAEKIIRKNLKPKEDEALIEELLKEVENV